jgi:hypothetical protein
LSKLDVYRVRSIYTYPFQNAELALQFASAAFLDGDYEAAYALVSEAEKKYTSLEQFQQALVVKDQDHDHDPTPESLEIFRLYHVTYHPDHTIFIVVGRNQKNEKSYYLVRTVFMPDGVFRIVGAASKVEPPAAIRNY